VAAHPRRARQPRRDDDDVRTSSLLVARRADDIRLVAEHRTHLVDVQRLPLGQPFLDVDEDDVRVVARRQHLRAGGADVPRADDRDFGPLAHARTPAPSFSTIASATSLVPTAVGSLREGFMSYVTLFPSRITAPIACSSASAASVSSRWRNINMPDSICAIGLTLF